MKNIRRQALLVSIGALAACGGPAVSIATSSHAPQPGGLRATAAVQPAHLLLQQGETSLSQVAMLDVKTGKRADPLPDGAVSADWSRMYAVTGAGTTTVLRSFDPRTGTAIASTPTQPGFTLPALGLAKRPKGLSPSGRRLVLSGQPTSTDRALTTSRFLVYDLSSLTQPPQQVSLAGDFAYDGISNDGRNLYLLENLNVATEGGAYHVRRFDLPSNRLDPAVLVDKRTGEKQLTGDATDSATSRDGAWQYTVYAFGASSPFIHALNLDDASSYCIDLPKAPLDQAMDLLWGLAASHDGRFVYALNAGNGAVVKMPPSTPWEAQLGSFTVPAPISTEAWSPMTVVTVDAKRIAYGAASISLDDRTLYGLGDLGIFAVDTSTLVLTGHKLLPTQPLTSLVLSADGRTLYATSLDSVTPLLQVSTSDGTWAAISSAGRPLSVLLATP